MMRKVLIVFLLLPLMNAFPAIGYEPAISMRAGFSSVKSPYDSLRSSPNFELELDLLSLKMERRHVLSLPVAIGYTATTRTINNVRLQDHFDISLALAYRYKALSFLHLRARAIIQMDIYQKSGGIVMKYGGEIEFWLLPASFVAITFPFRTMYSQGNYYISGGIGVSFLFGKGDVL